MRFLIIIIFVFIINCSGNKVTNYHGTKLLEEKYNQIEVNISNKNDIVEIIGQPSTISDFNPNRWFYVERLKTNQSLFKLGTKIIKKNNILIVDLNKKGILKSKQLLTLDDMNDVKYLKQITSKEFDKNNNVFGGLITSFREKINAPMRNR